MNTFANQADTDRQRDTERYIQRDTQPNMRNITKHLLTEFGAQIIDSFVQ